MSLKQDRTHTLGRLSALALVLVTLIGAGEDKARWAHVAEPPSSTTADFRARIVREWNWRPDYGVALTTTRYAREYLERRGYSRGESEKLPLIRQLSPYKLVLFQTDHLDIVVSKVPTQDIKVAIIERDTGKYLLRALNGGVDRIIRGRFVDVDRSPPFELKYYSRSSGGAGLELFSLRVFDLRSGLEPLLAVEGRYEDHSCPEAQLKPLTGTVVENDGGVTVHSRTDLMLRSGPFQHCAPVGPETRQRHDCEFDRRKRSYKCVMKATQTDTIVLDDLKPGGWQPSAENIRWVLDNSDRLESLGFRFPDGFLARLPRHLP